MKYCRTAKLLGHTSICKDMVYNEIHRRTSRIIKETSALGLLTLRRTVAMISSTFGTYPRLFLMLIPPLPLPLTQSTDPPCTYPVCAPHSASWQLPPPPRCLSNQVPAHHHSPSFHLFPSIAVYYASIVKSSTRKNASLVTHTSRPSSGGTETSRTRCTSLGS